MASTKTKPKNKGGRKTSSSRQNSMNLNQGRAQRTQSRSGDQNWGETRGQQTQASSRGSRAQASGGGNRGRSGREDKGREQNRNRDVGNENIWQDRSRFSSGSSFSQGRGLEDPRRDDRDYGGRFTQGGQYEDRDRPQYNPNRDPDRYGDDRFDGPRDQRSLSDDRGTRYASRSRDDRDDDNRSFRDDEDYWNQNDDGDEASDRRSSGRGNRSEGRRGNNRY